MFAKRSSFHFENFPAYIKQSFNNFNFYTRLDSFVYLLKKWLMAFGCYIVIFCRKCYVSFCESLVKNHQIDYFI